MRPEDVDLSKGERIAFASSEADGRDRWTELAVYYFADPPTPKRHWLSQSVGRSVVPGERDKERRLLVGSLERALKLFDEGTDLGVIVCEQAREWWEERNLVDMVVQTYHHPALSPTLSGDALRFSTSRPPLGLKPEDIARGWSPYPIGDDRAALAWLYGVTPGELPSVNSMAADLGLGESTLRMALKNGTGIKVPLAHIGSLIDRDLFQRRREQREKGDA